MALASILLLFTKVTRGVHVAEYNGSEFKGCHPTDDGKVVIPFDGHNFGMGVLNVKREFFLNDKDFSDGVCNLVSVEATGIILDNGATSDIGEIDVQLEPYYHTIGGGTSSDIPDGSVTEGKLANNAVSTSKIKDGAVTEDKLSEALRTKLNAALMASDVQKGLGDSDLPISQAAVKNAINSISEMIVSVINTPT